MQTKKTDNMQGFYCESGHSKNCLHLAQIAIRVSLWLMFDSHFRQLFSHTEAKIEVGITWLDYDVRVSWFLFKTQLLLLKCKQLT